MRKRGEILGLVLIIILALVIVSNNASDSDQVQVDETVEEVLAGNLMIGDTADEETKVSVIITLREDVETNTEDLDDRKEAINDMQEEVLDNLDLEESKDLFGSEDNEPDLELEYQYSTINALAGNITKEGLEKLKDDPNVKTISYNYPITPLLDSSVPFINATSVWDLTVNGVPVNGTGQTVCVIDTGTDYTHPALGGCTSESFLAGTCEKVIGGYDFGSGDADPVDVHSHGSHVSGIVASNDTTYRGVAPGASLVAMKVFNDAGGGNTADAISAIDWCVNNASKFNISVITMSIGVTDGNNVEIPYLATCDSSDSLAAKASWAASQGFFVVASAGNNKAALGITAPACGENVTSVGSVNTADSISSYNTAPILSVLAPGASITSTCLSSTFCGKGGTSMAAPHTAGVGALMIDYWERAYNVTPTAFQIRNKLRWTGTWLNDTRNSVLFPRIDALKAVQPFINFTSTSPVNGTTLTTTYTQINISSDINITTAILQWNNGTFTNYTMDLNNATSFSYNLTGLNLGEHYYRVYGNDTVNTFGLSELRNITVDNIPPNITFTTPVNGTYFRQAFNLSILVSNVLLSTSYYNITNSTGTSLQQNINESVNVASHFWTDLINISNTTFNDDNYTLNVFANDSLGNIVNESITFVVDKTVPSVLGGNRTPITVNNNDTIIFKVNISDLYLNTSVVYLESNFSGSWANYTMDQEVVERYNYSLSGTTNLTNQKDISYRFYATDFVGNINVSSTFNFTVQNREPQSITITIPSTGIVLELDNSSQFNGTATDLDNDVLTYTWNFADGNTTNQQNITHAYNSTGNFTVALNVSDAYSSNSTNITVVVNDTRGPTITPTYNSEVHLERDTSMSLTMVATDYSGIFNFTAIFDALVLPLTSTYCTNLSTTTRSCSWTITFDASDVGTHNIIMNSTDNFATKHSNASNYTVSFTSCSDSAQNGDETGTDCGGSCDACSSGSTSSTSSTGSSSGGGGGGGTTTTAAAEDTAVEEDADESVAVETSDGAVSSSGSAAAAEIDQPVENVIFTQDINFKKKESQTINVGNAGISINEIEIQTKVDKDVTLEITHHPQKPEEVLELKNVYQYLKIETGLEENEIKDAKITFTIPKSWLVENNFLNETVRLKHYIDEKWEELDTELFSQTKESLTYRAETDSFSYFAVTASTEMELAWWKIFIPPESGTKSFVLFSIIVAIIILLVIYFLVRNK
jgi:PGF-pre-PGF domain-containing protein